MSEISVVLVLPHLYKPPEQWSSSDRCFLGEKNHLSTVLSVMQQMWVSPGPSSPFAEQGLRQVGTRNLGEA